MKLRYKVTLLAAALAFTANNAMADAAAFQNDDDRAVYAFGVSFAKSFEEFFKEQNDLGMKIDNAQLIAGVQDTLAGKSKLTDQEVQQSIQQLQNRLKDKLQKQAEQEEKAKAEQAVKNAADGASYREEFAKQPNVVKTDSGLLFRIDQPGTGANPVDSDTIVVNYKGSLIDGTVFDSSYERNQPVTFPLQNVIPGWREGLTHAQKGGKVTLVIAPELAYGEQGVGEIPGNSTLVFEVELLDINPQVEPAK